MPERSLDRDAVIAATQEAAALAFTSWRDGAVPDTKVWEKSKNNPVSDIDMAVDALLTAAVARDIARGGVAVGGNGG